MELFAILVLFFFVLRYKLWPYKQFSKRNSIFLTIFQSFTKLYFGLSKQYGLILDQSAFVRYYDIDKRWVVKNSVTLVLWGTFDSYTYVSLNLSLKYYLYVQVQLKNLVDRYFLLIHGGSKSAQGASLITMTNLWWFNLRLGNTVLASWKIRYTE